VIIFLVPEAGAFTTRDYLADRGRALAAAFRVLPYEKVPQQREFTRGTYVLAGLDQLGPGMTRLVTELHARLAGEPDVRFLNHPVRTLRRFALLTELHRSGLNTFRAVRATAPLRGLRYPVFLRGERLHEGALSGLLATPAEVRAAIGLAILQGHRLSDLLLVEFCGTADETGLYRKYAAFVVGDRVIPRRISHGPHWMLKSATAQVTSEYLAEEHAYFAENPHAVQIAEVARRAGVEYGRIDYSMLGDRVQTWELNLNPTIGRRPNAGPRKVPPEYRAVRDAANAIFYQRFQEAFEAVNLCTEPDAVVEVRFGGRTVRAAIRERSMNRGLLDPLRRLLRSSKPMTEPVARRMLPWVGRIARGLGALG
jgi:hypothetical protein